MIIALRVQVVNERLTLIRVQTLNAEEKSAFTFDDAMSFVGAGELVVA